MSEDTMREEHRDDQPSSPYARVMALPEWLRVQLTLLAFMEPRASERFYHNIAVAGERVLQHMQPVSDEAEGAPAPEPPGTCPLCERVHDPVRMAQWDYLPLCCPHCGRRRLEYNGYHVVCEKCRVVDWLHDQTTQQFSPTYP